MSEPAEGLLLVDKPRGPTSHDIVAAVRRSMRVSRVGHCGTLDPLASGLLPLLLGRATRLGRFLPQSPKVYQGSLQLGWSSTTDDVTGEPLGARVEEHALPEARSVLAAAQRFVGPQMQSPPTFSARKVGGVRSYRLARRGLTPAGSPTPIEVFRFELVAGERRDLYEFEVEVSSGTYIRALARDLGRDLGCGGVLECLVRTRIGPMQLSDAIPIGPDLDPDRLRRHVVPLEGLPLTPPPVRLTADEAGRFRAGAPVGRGSEFDGMVRALDDEGRLLGVAEAREGWLHPRVVLRGCPQDG